MTRKKVLSIIFTLSFLGSLASCGNNHHATSDSSLSTCDEVSCLSSVNWKILLPGRSFPEKTRIDINGSTILNECVSKQKYAVDRTKEPEMLYLDNFFVPTPFELKIDVFDLGHDCQNESLVLANDKVDFEVSKVLGVTEIIISL
jgi:hypothetical protein